MGNKKRKTHSSASSSKKPFKPNSNSDSDSSVSESLSVSLLLPASLSLSASLLSDTTALRRRRGRFGNGISSEVGSESEKCRRGIETNRRNFKCNRIGEQSTPQLTAFAIWLRKQRIYIRMTYLRCRLTADTHPIAEIAASPPTAATCIKSNVLATDQSVGPVSPNFHWNRLSPLRAAKNTGQRLPSSA